MKLLMACGVPRNVANMGAEVVRGYMMINGREMRPGCYELAWGTLMYHAAQRKREEAGSAEA